MSPIEISIAAIMVGVAVVFIMLLQSSHAATSARRMRGMMTRLGLDPGTVRLDDPRTMALNKEARRRCRSCPREDLCDRWLAGKVEGAGAFCPNAQTFRVLAEAGGRSN